MPKKSVAPISSVSVSSVLIFLYFSGHQCVQLSTDGCSGLLFASQSHSMHPVSPTIRSRRISSKLRCFRRFLFPFLYSKRSTGKLLRNSRETLSPHFVVLLVCDAARVRILQSASCCYILRSNGSSSGRAGFSDFNCSAANRWRAAAASILTSGPYLQTHLPSHDACVFVDNVSV